MQRHRARRLHYDLRLEADGVLVSWAVPKGPTLDPDVKRMAAHVEDHPLDYFDFEGVIPAGEYGGGDVIVWDWGTWSLAKGKDPLKAIEAGDLHFDLHGEKLRGRFALVRRGRDDKQWLLIHKHDDARRQRLGSGGPPDVGEDRSHQRRGEGRTGGHVVEHRELGGADRPTSSPRSTPWARPGSGSSGSTR